MEKLETFIDLFSSLFKLRKDDTVDFILNFINNDNFKENINNIFKELTAFSVCISCNQIIYDNNCTICKNSEKYSKLIITSSLFDSWKIQKIKNFKGMVFILNWEAEYMKAKKIFYDMTKLNNLIDINNFSEIIIATNPTIAGNLTKDYLMNNISKRKNAVITSMSYGISFNLNIRYNDIKAVEMSYINRYKIIK